MDWQEIDKNITLDEFYTSDGYHDAFKLLRDHDPVHWTDNSYGRPLWHVTRHADIVRVQTDAETFSSKYGGNLPPDPAAFLKMDHHALGFDAIPTFVDAPNHLIYRRPFNKHFTPHTVLRLAATIEQITDDIIAEVGPRGSCDLVQVAGELPLRLILNMMDIPKQDWGLMHRLALVIQGSTDPEFRHRPGVSANESRFGAFQELYEYLSPLAAERRKNPGDDLISMIASMSTEGEPWDMYYVGWWCWTFVVGGLDTTQNGFSTGMHAMLQNPEQANLVRSDPALLDTAIEEVLRWSSPSKHTLRVATRDVELCGKTIKKDDWVVSWLVSGNRDERVFDNPMKFDVTRNPNPHLTFNAQTSPHLCLGRNLARLEMRTLVNALLNKFHNIELAGEVEWLESNNVTGPKRLPVKYDPVVA